MNTRAFMQSVGQHTCNCWKWSTFVPYSVLSVGDRPVKNFV